MASTNPFSKSGDNASSEKTAWWFRWYGRVPLTITLASAIGLLVFLTAGIVFAISAWLAQENTFDLISANAHQSITADVNQLELHLKPAEYQVRFIARAISNGDIDPESIDTFSALLSGSLAAVPQIEAVIYMNADFQAFSAGRHPGRPEVTFHLEDYSSDPAVLNNKHQIKQEPSWLPPLWREDQQRTFLSRAERVLVDGRFAGAVIAVVSVEHLSNFISLQSIGHLGNRFILYGKNHVLAHWLLANEFPGRSEENPLPKLNSFSDPILASIWQGEDLNAEAFPLPEGTYGHLVEQFNERYAFVFREVEGFGDKPLIVGSYFQASDYAREVGRLFAGLLAGIVLVFLSLIAAIILGRRIARPIVRFSNAASQIRALEVSNVKELRGSIFKELNDQSIAFNAMLRALRWFEFYVPKSIVRQIIHDGDFQNTLTDTQEITVLFTDVVGFSAVSEGMTATELASFVNQHFAMLVKCIEAESGVVDKFMGDAVMAFWSTGENANDGRDKACRAALAIAESIHNDNIDRQSKGLSPISIRIGIHTGQATVGNIGAPGRLNYTIIGDTVNIGQRLEQLGKEFGNEHREVGILLSADTAENLTDSNYNLESIGSYQLKGRRREIDVYRLSTPFE